MHALDDPAALTDQDTSGMLGCVDRLPEVIEAAFARGKACSLPSGTFDMVLVCGMGGSAISGDVLRTWALDAAPVPVLVHRGDVLPAYVGARCLLICLTYSGNTAETVSTLQQAIARGVSTVVISSGGQAVELARSAGLPVVDLPGGWQPRAALGDLLFALLGVVTSLPGFPAVDVARIADHLRARRALWAVEVPSALNPAKRLATALKGRLPFLLGTGPSTEAVAVRWKCQINENAKATALLGHLPEFTHNDIVNLTAQGHPDLVLIHFKDPGDTALLQRQRLHTLDLLRPHLGGVQEVEGEGGDLLTRQLQMIYLGDYTSVYLGLLNGHDPTPVAAIGELKRRMALALEENNA
ncbi:MAG: bifunctional phosphoglucose/phosphomannose isomerase [Candidatus Sericytochromatia bacterium]|nr:bifunctional phosphoglucose/phosphomannose isomerase [Candidatus Sericytochromatia bacterium]